MSRLRNHQLKENTKKVVIILLGVVLLVIFMIQYGFKALIGATVLINNGFSGEETTQNTSNNEDFFGTLYVNEPPNATNSATIAVTGEVSDFERLEFYINNTKVKQVDLKKDSFSTEISKLKQGENKMYVIAKTKDGKHSKESEQFSIIYKSEPLTLEITSPKDNDTVSKQDLMIEGKTDADATVQVNNQPVVVNFEGNFKKSYRLKEGENKLEVKVRDEAGNTVTKSITIKYQKDE